jgi:hypothetical protein
MVSYWEITIYYAVAVLATGGASLMFDMGRAAIINAKAQLKMADKADWVVPSDDEE